MSEPTAPQPRFQTPQKANELKRCEGCPHGFARLVGTRGDPQHPLVIVGESPGSQEIKTGVPFSGPSGKVLMHALSQHPDILESEPYMINAFQCFPGKTTAKDSSRVQSATHTCQTRLKHAIQAYPRKVILALGNPAVWSSTGQFGYKITQVRGTNWESSLAEFGIVAAVHPSFLLRGGGSMRQFMADVDYACGLVKGRGRKRYILPSKLSICQSPSDVRRLAEKIHAQQYVAADIETGGYQGFDFLRDRILMVGFCWDPNEVHIVPEELIPHTRYIFTAQGSHTRFIWHNGKFDIKFFWKLGIPARVDEDTMLLSYAIDETGGIHDLEQLAGDILGFPDWKFMIKPYIGKKKTYADIPKEVLYDYASRDISGTLQIFPFLRNQVRLDPHLEKLYTRSLIPMTQYLARIEMRGMVPDLAQVELNAKVKGALANELESEFNLGAVQSGFGMLNPRSPQQVGAYLYDHLRLRDARKPNVRPQSTNEDTLLTLGDHPAVKCLLKYREVQKGLSTYVNSIPEHIGGDGRIHCSYKIHGTTTGRFASADPNLLNIPREPTLRAQLKASEGRVLIEVDVNQAELRVLAELSRDPTLIDIYLTPGAPSIHKVTQTDMFGDPKLYDEQTWLKFEEKFSTWGDRERTLDEQNMRAKCVNFGIVYGRTAGSIAEEFRPMTIAEAQEWISKWFQKYSKAGEFIRKCRAAPLYGNNLITTFGRKRRFMIVNRERLDEIQNQAANFYEQSIAADCVAHTGMAVQEFAYREYQSYIVNTVYDSLLFECPDNPALYFELGARVLKVLKEVPKKWGLTLIPFKGDLKVGYRWGEGKKTPIPADIQEKVDKLWPTGM